MKKQNNIAQTAQLDGRIDRSETPFIHRTSAAVMAACLFVMLMASGCASTKVTNQQRFSGESLPKPGNILVYNFAATPADVPPHSTLSREYSIASSPQTPHDIEVGRELGSQIASELVKRIREMGLPVVYATASTPQQVNDLVIAGYLVSVNEGSAAKRVTIGFGAGASEPHTAVEGFQVTPQGLRKLGAGTVDAGGSKTPGAALGAATFAATANPAGLIVSSGMKIYGEASGKSKVEGRATQTAKEIAEALEKRFKQQDWIP